MSVEKALNKFGKELVKNSRKALKKNDKNASGALSKSLDFKVKVSKNSFEFSFFMEDYGKFVDRGVKGVGGNKADGTQWKRKRVTNNDFSYRSKMPPTKAFDKWGVRRGLAPRTATGQFTTRKSLNFALATSVFHTGLETTDFLTNSFKKAFKNLPNQIVESFGLEVDKFLLAIN